jgi:UDP-2,3-diacylglucosamine pyrophosphatase LpxH
MSARKLLVQVYSDIHIELWNKVPDLPVKAKYLFLAGDICDKNNPLFYKFLDYCSEWWEKVFYTPGNHEFYIRNKNYNQLIFEYKFDIEKKYKNIYFIDNESVKLNDDIDVYGSTFWTKSPFDKTYEAKLSINDYNWITYFNQSKRHVVDLDIGYVNELSETSYNKLKQHLTSTKKTTIVMTHFPPIRTGTSDPIYLSQDRKVNPYFSWPDETIDDFDLTKVPIWISGHTHWSYDINKNGTRFVGNQLGYKSEIGKTGVNEDGLFEIIF